MVTQKKIALFTVNIITLICISFSFAYSGPVRIMPLGDSITLGYSAIIQNNNYMISYRQKLYLDLVNSGYNINFVGSLNSGMSIHPAFDVNHEGHGGWCADACDPPYEGLKEHVYNFLTNNPADVVLLHIGTNDIGMNLQDPNAVGRVLDEIYRYDTNITVILARIINRTDGKASQTTQFNTDIEALAKSRSEYGETLFLVDMEHTLNYPDDMDDALHPNQTGYGKMANVWREALCAILPLPTWLLTVHKSGTGRGTITSSPSSIDCGGTCSASLPQGTVIMLTATAEYGATLSTWTGCDSVDGNTCAVTMDSNRTVTATFDIVYKDLTIHKSGTGHGTITSSPSPIDCGGTCSASLPQGTVIMLTATAEYGATLSTWTGCDSVDGNTCAVTMDSNRTVTATFRAFTEVKLLSPNGGEIIPAGSEYPDFVGSPP